MKITYINHSGFLVETKECYYIFDYYKGELPALDTSRRVIVFASHFHQDHYNPEIFSILDNMGASYEAILAKDINKRKYPDGVKITKAYSNSTYTLDNGTTISTLPSTDSGVAYIIKTSEGVIYHAGDLNDWYWEGEPDSDNRQMTSRYRAEINKIKDITFDVAFVPLDPRQESHYADGMLYFIENVKCEAIYPMHYWNEPAVIDKFCSEYPQYKEIIRNTEKAREEQL